LNNFGDIVAFVRVVEARSFVAAAESLGLSSSAISKAVTRLEERLGARLLNRTTRALSLTELGSAYYDRCREAMGKLEDAESDLAEARGTPRGRLRIDMPLALGRNFIVPAMPRFLEQYPEISVHLSMNDQKVDLIQEGFDAAVRLGRLDDSSLIARKVATLRGVTCASPDFIERIGLPKTPEDLDPKHCIGLFRIGTGTPREWIFRKQEAMHVVLPSGRLSLSDPETAAAAAVSGAGFVRLLDFNVEVQIATGLLQPVLADWNEGATWPVSVVYPQNRQPTAKLKAFMEFVAGVFPSV
jgi:DNA-binding transcriptional LysR family regulator